MEQFLGEQKLEKGILKQLFLQRLPVNVRLILASTSETLSLSDLADLADRIIEAHPEPLGTMSAIAQTPVVQAKPTSTLESQMTDLTRLVRELRPLSGACNVVKAEAVVAPVTAMENATRHPTLRLTNFVGIIASMAITRTIADHLACDRNRKTSQTRQSGRCTLANEHIVRALSCDGNSSMNNIHKREVTRSCENTGRDDVDSIFSRMLSF